LPALLQGLGLLEHHRSHEASASRQETGVSRPDRYTDELGATIRKRYERMESCQDIADSIGVSYSATRLWLIRAGTQMRQASRTTSKPAPTGTVMGRAFTPTARKGYSQVQSVRTTCKLCRSAVLATDAAVWRSATPLGLVHAWCNS
jgi:hypothetical protein